MPLPSPEIGLVFPYVYLWRHQHEAGEESGRKARPCLLLLLVISEATSTKTVIALPITTKLPDETRSFVEIPQRVKNHLGLNAPKSWVMCDEYNQIVWPSGDLAKTASGETSYGFVPDAFLSQVRQEVQAARNRRALQTVPRTD